MPQSVHISSVSPIFRKFRLYIISIQLKGNNVDNIQARGYIQAKSNKLELKINPLITGTLVNLHYIIHIPSASQCAVVLQMA